MKIDLTKEEATSLANLIDVAVKSVGLRAAPFAVAMIQKLDAAATAEQVVPAEDTRSNG